jgi:cysteine desulfurase/selenocysteine lyase
MNNFNTEKIRKDFPIFERLMHNKPLVYLDSAATSQKPIVVINSLIDFYTKHNANIHRGVYEISEEATDIYESTREQIAKFIGANSARSIIFVRNTTEAINLIAHSWGDKNINEGDEIILSEMEHHSNIIPWQLLAQRKRARIIYIPVDSNGNLDSVNLNELISDKTKIISIAHISNALGTINPIKEIINLAHSKNILVSIDGAQSAPHLKIDVKNLDCDFFAFSAHKMLGPMGIGALYVKEEIEKEMPPFLGGGNMILDVNKYYTKYNEIPWMFEAGTANAADVAGWLASIKYLENIGLDKIEAYVHELTNYALNKLSELSFLDIYGPKDAKKQNGIISFNISNIHPHDLGTFLDYEGVAVRAGHHCAQILMKKFNLTGTVRASFYIYNTTSEIDILCELLKKAFSFFNIKNFKIIK